MLTAGQDSDHGQAKALIGDVVPGAVVGDKGYDSQSFAEFSEQRNAEVVIPTRKNAKQHRSIDKNLYKDRNKIERFFNKIKHYRRIATRQDKTAASYLGLVYVAATLFLLL